MKYIIFSKIYVLGHLRVKYKLKEFFHIFTENNMKILWILSFIVMIAAMAMAKCPSEFTLENNACYAKRPVRGSCPPGSNLNAKINLCVAPNN